jgi:hypothetical protein
MARRREKPHPPARCHDVRLVAQIRRLVESTGEAPLGWHAMLRRFRPPLQDVAIEAAAFRYGDAPLRLWTVCSCAGWWDADFHPQDLQPGTSGHWYCDQHE